MSAKVRLLGLILLIFGGFGLSLAFSAKDILIAVIATVVFLMGLNGLKNG